MAKLKGKFTQRKLGDNEAKFSIVANYVWDTETGIVELQFSNIVVKDVTASDVDFASEVDYLKNSIKGGTN